MARISIWLLATVAAVNLASAVPMPSGNDNTEVDDKKVLANIYDMPYEILEKIVRTLPDLDDRRNLAIAYPELRPQVSDIQRIYFSDKRLIQLRSFLGLPTDTLEPISQFLLRTLLDGAQFEFRDMVYRFMTWMYPNGNGKTTKESDYPDLFKNFMPLLDSEEEYNDPWFKEPYSTGYIKLSDIKHGLFKMVGRYKTPSIVIFIKKLFKTLKGNDLVSHFKNIGGLPLVKLSKTPDLNSRYKNLAATGTAQPEDVHAFLHQFWLEVICDSRPKELQYYLTNMLVFDVIPLLISRKLYDNVDGALELASGISQLEKFTGYVDAYYDEDYRDNAPNYHEFMVIYAMQHNLPDPEKIIRATISNGGDKEQINARLLYDCAKQFKPLYNSDVLQAIFGFEPLSDPKAWKEENEVQCTQLLGKYMRGFQTNSDLKMHVFMLPNEEIHNVIEPYAKQ